MKPGERGFDRRRLGIARGGSTNCPGDRDYEMRSPTCTVNDARTGSFLKRSEARIRLRRSPEGVSWHFWRRIAPAHRVYFKLWRLG